MLVRCALRSEMPGVQLTPLIGCPIMVRMRPTLSRDEEIGLHRRLVEGDPVAPAELAQAYLEPLVMFLRQTNTVKVSQDFLQEAASEALVRLIKRPTAFDASRSRARLPLFTYLKMAAKGDLKNILKKEERHRHGRTTLESVELLSDGWKYLSRADDPSRRLLLQEEAAKAERGVVVSVCEGLSDGEQQALQLVLRGERKTIAFAKALGLE